MSNRKLISSSKLKEEQERVNKKDMKLKKNSIYKRKKRKPNGEMVSLSTTKVLLCLTFVKLLCDIWSPSSDCVLVQAANEQQAGAISTRQRFLEEPKDTIAVLGQPADLNCLVENKRGALHWYRDDFGLGSDGISQSYATRYSLPPQSGESAQPSLGNEQVSVSNCTLHINSVSLLEDAHFYCKMVELVTDQPDQTIESRHVQLTVLQPPTNLSVVAHVAYDTSHEDQILFDSKSEDDGHNHFHVTSAGIADEQILVSPDAKSLSLLSATVEEQSEAVIGENSDIIRIVVRQNTRLRLECRADQAKPHAELIWLDHQKHQVPKRHETNNGTETTDASYVEELVRIDGSHPKLESASLVWNFKVQRHHSNKVLTCLSRHPAFEHQQIAPQLYGRELKRQVKLEVHYEPEIDLTKDQLHLYENKPVKFQCNAQAKPNMLTYRWFIDNQLIVNASEPNLHIQSLTRQMHLREIKCEVRNTVGVSSAVLRLAVRYAPAYITHLLPASLQPAPIEPQHSSDFEQLSQKLYKPIKQQSNDRTANINRLLSETEIALSRQLALGFESGQDVQLRCDFDSNPRLQQVLWFKMATDYSIMSDVTPTEADELITSGAAHAIFRERPHAHTDTPTLNYQQTNERHFSKEEGIGDDLMDQVNLDYEQMSIELLDELTVYEKLISKRHNNLTTGSGQVVEPIASPMPTQTNVRIQEPLDWIITKPLIALNWHSEQPSNSPQNYHLEQGQQASLKLIRPTNLTSSTIHQARLLKREAQVSSSFISLTSANEDSMGKYVCKAKSADGSSTTARAVYLVLRQSPRIVSGAHQWAPLGSHHLQVECLTQISTVVDNVTSISWSKDGKAIDVMRRDETSRNIEKNFAITEERSPDLLFMRSILRIDGAELFDFGQYNCTISNSLGTDSMIINLQPSAPTGFVFAVMASMAVGSILLLVCVASLLIIITARRKPDAKISMQPAKATNVDCLDGSQSDRKSPHSIDSRLNGIVCVQANTQQHCDNELANQRKQFIPQLVATNSMVMIGDNLNSQHNQRESIDAYQLNESTAHNRILDHHHKLRSSLRQPIVGQQRSSKFVAIHESLEHRLHFPSRAPSDLELQQHQHQSSPQRQPDNMATKNQAISELESSSLINRLWTRLLMRPERSATGSGRRIKSRPIISMPVSVTNQRTMRRSSLSTSLSVLGVSAPDGVGSGNTKNNSANLNHINGGNLVSSSANLIQDSTTASDGTESSRSSSSSGQNHELNAQNTDPHSTYATSYMQQSMWIQPQQSPHQTDQSPKLLMINDQSSQDTNQLNCNLYVNGGTTQTTTNQQENNANHHLYTNGQLPYPGLDQSKITNGYTTTNQQLNWTDHNQPLASIGHYQLPMLVSESYFTAQQQNQHPCYATICNKPVHFGSANNNNYGTLPLQPHNAQCPQMVPTSDAGDAYFESNYGTLISRSSAYKTLGYATTLAPSIQHNSHSASSSPNSMTTQPNNMSNLNQNTIQEQATPVPIEELQYNNDNQITMVQSDGSTTSAKNLNDNSLATHV